MGPHETPDPKADWTEEQIRESTAALRSMNRRHPTRRSEEIYLIRLAAERLESLAREVHPANYDVGTENLIHDLKQLVADGSPIRYWR